MGWLTVQTRRDRRDRPYTLTDKKVSQLCDKVLHYRNWIKNNPLLEKFVKSRDIALISANWIFFKRAGEVLRLKFSDIHWNDTTLAITFTIQKKLKHRVTCPNPECKEINGYRNKFCRSCGISLEGVQVETYGKDLVVVKEKDLSYSFALNVTRWIEACNKYFKPDDASFLFAPAEFLDQPFMWFNWGRHITIQWYDKILQKLDPSITSCHFRYGGAEKFLRLGYTPFDLKTIGDWESSDMPERYAQRKGLTPELKRFRQDLRTIE